MFFSASATFNVQDFTIEEINDAVLLTCVYADNSHADGCIVNFVQNDTATIEHLIPKQIMNEDIASIDVIIPNGDYTVLVYDVINGQPISISPAYTTRYTVTHVSTTSSTAIGMVVNLLLSVMILFLIATSTPSADINTSSGSIISTAESELPENECKLNYIYHQLN